MSRCFGYLAKGQTQHAFKHLEDTFPKPKEPLGEAWFMGESREMFDDLNTDGIKGIKEGSKRDLDWILTELLGGLAHFPGCSNWPEWYAYFVPRLLDSKEFGGLGWCTTMCQGLIILSRGYADDPINGYETDFATVLIPWIMEAHHWKRNHFRPLWVEPGLQDRWGAIDVHEDISVALFMAWRYLPPHALDAWFHSVLAIKDALWRAHLIVWLVCIWPIFENGSATISILLDKNLQISTLWSAHYWSVQSAPPNERDNWPLVSTENIAALHTAIRHEFSPRKYFEWIDQFSANTYLWMHLENWMLRFQDRYL